MQPNILMRSNWCSETSVVSFSTQPRKRRQPLKHITDYGLQTSWPKLRTQNSGTGIIRNSETLNKCVYTGSKTNTAAGKRSQTEQKKSYRGGKDESSKDTRTVPDVIALIVFGQCKHILGEKLRLPGI